LTTANETTIGAILTVFGLLFWTNVYFIWRIYVKKKYYTDYWIQEYRPDLIL